MNQKLLRLADWLVEFSKSIILLGIALFLVLLAITLVIYVLYLFKIGALYLYGN